MSDRAFVCKTHLNFVPCRRYVADCELTSNPEIVEVVRIHQKEVLYLKDIALKLDYKLFGVSLEHIYKDENGNCKTCKVKSPCPTRKIIEKKK